MVDRSPLSRSVAVNLSKVTVSGGSITGLWTSTFSGLNDPTVTLVGTDFKVDGMDVPYGPLPTGSGTLTGTLANGDLLDVSYSHSIGSFILAAPATIPALREVPMALLALGLLLIGRRGTKLTWRWVSSVQ